MDATIELAGSCLMALLLLPFLPFYILYRDLQLRAAHVIEVKARLTRREYIDHMGWSLSFETYGRTLKFDAGKVEDPPPAGTVGLLTYRAWQYLSFHARPD